MEYLEGYWGSSPQWTRTQLLSTSDEVGSFVVGDRVRVREGIQLRYGHVGEVGEVVEIEDGQIRVCFPNCDRWHGPSELLPAVVADNLQVGSKVRVCALRPTCGWGNAAPGEIGEVVQLLQWDVVMVRFPREPKWYGKRSEVEVVDPFALPGGHEADWVNPDVAKEFECPICMKVCSNPLMHSCCQIFCELCWKECQKFDSRCPMCRMEEPAVPAYRCRKEIEKLQLRCPRGCGATFPLLQKDMVLQHLDHLECSFHQADGCNAELQETQESVSFANPQAKTT